jgi:hypothetical protein
MEVSAAVEPAQVRDEDLLLLAVDLGGLTIADSLAAYGDPTDPLLPMGELSRLLDLNITVSPGERRITGRIGESERSLTVDMDTGLARVGGRDVTLTAADVAVTGNEIYIRASAMERLLPLTIKTDLEELSLKLKALEKLPIQSRLERIARLRDLRPDAGSPDAVMRVESPYEFFTMPSFDVAISTARDTRPPNNPRRYDVRIGSDLFYTGFQGYLGSDDNGALSTARVLFERHDAKGGLLGPLNATSAQAGDTYTPGLPIGPRSGSGRGFNFTTAPLEQASVFSRIDLRGELPLGYDVELYVNDILRSGQRTPVEGRYEFLQVPLSRGINVIRIVTYGPRGERDEDTRVINVGGGQLKPGDTTFDFGIVQQDRPVLAVTDAEKEADGGIRAIASVTRGITESITMLAGLAYYPDLLGNQRSLAMVGARASFQGFAVQTDVAADHQGGVGMAVGIAGERWGASILGRHAEYRGGFIDESNPSGVSVPILRHSELSVDTSLTQGPRTIPLSMRVQRDQYESGAVSIDYGVRSSTNIGPVQLSGGIDYRRDTTRTNITVERMTGVLAAAVFASYKWQLRGSVDYEIKPDPRAVALSITADRAISKTMALRFGLGHGFGKLGTTVVQAGANWRLKRGDLALSADYAQESGDWRVGVQYAFGLAFDPLDRRYRVTRTGPATGGNVVLQAFVDTNGDGIFDKDEKAVQGVSVMSGGQTATTTINGRALISGVGAAPTGRVQVNLEDVDNPYLTAPPQTVEFSPRMGGTTTVMYPLTPTSEVLARIMFKAENGQMVGLSAVRVLLKRQGKEPVEGTTEFDGSIAYQGLPAGTYELELDPEQAGRLNMSLRQSVTFTISREGGYVPDVTAEVVFAKPEETAS